MHPKPWHTVIILVALSFAIVFAEIPRETWLTSAALSLAAGASALSLMGAAALLGGRLKWVESAFGGLDRVYITHKWLGVWALALASFHLVFKAGLDGWHTASILSLPPFYTRLVRQLSFVALMAIVLLALNRNIPYRVWRSWHKLSGPLFVIVILHWLSFKTPIALASPAAVWLGTVSALGLGAAAYKLLLYPFLSSHALYRVVAASPGASALHLEMVPVGDALAFEAGQFGFISMKEDGLREPHPFTIASGSGPGERVHFVIRDLGDYTHKLLKETTLGMHADIYGPFGRFKRRQSSRPEVWIAGGVGISPFIAWLTDRCAGDFDKVTLFYFYTPDREFPSAQVLDDLAQQRGAELVAICGEAPSPEFAERFAEIVLSSGPASIDVSFCGPKGLMSVVKAAMHANAVPAANLRYEYFEFR